MWRGLSVNYTNPRMSSLLQLVSDQWPATKFFSVTKNGRPEIDKKLQKFSRHIKIYKRNLVNPLCFGLPVNAIW